MPEQILEDTDLESAELDEVLAELRVDEVAEPVEFAEPPPEPDLALPTGLIACILGGFALTLSRSSLGHWGAATAAALGVIVAVIGLFLASRRWLVPMAALGFNVGILLVAIFLPHWLGLGSWRTRATADNDTTVMAVGANGVAVPADEWINAAESSWQRGPARISLERVRVGPVDLTGPQNQKRTTRENYLQLRLRLENVSLDRVVDFRGWRGAGDRDEPRLADADGRVFAGKVLESGWEPSGAAMPATLNPGEAMESVLYFEAVPGSIRDLRLELPGSAFDSPASVRFHIPRALIQF